MPLRPPIHASTSTATATPRVSAAGVPVRPDHGIDPRFAQAGGTSSDVLDPAAYRALAAKYGGYGFSTGTGTPTAASSAAGLPPAGTAAYTRPVTSVPGVGYYRPSTASAGVTTPRMGSIAAPTVPTIPASATGTPRAYDRGRSLASGMPVSLTASVASQPVTPLSGSAVGWGAVRASPSPWYRDGYWQSKYGPGTGTGSGSGTPSGHTMAPGLSHSALHVPVLDSFGAGPAGAAGAGRAAPHGRY